MPVKTWVGRFVLIDGQPQEEGPFLRSFLRHRPEEQEDDELYVLATPAAPGSEEHCPQLVEAVGRLYQQDSLSMTGAVQRAVLAAHRQLQEWNERSLREHRVAAGVTCLAVRGRTAYLAQVGPGIAYVLHEGEFASLRPEEEHARPLGLAEPPAPRFHRYQLAPGDVLVVASPALGELLDDDAVRALLHRGGEAALGELFRLTRDQQDFSLLLLACELQPDEQPERPPTPPIEETPAEAAPEEPAATPVGAVAGAAGATASATALEPPRGLSDPPLRLKAGEAGLRYPASTGLRAALPRVPPLAIVLALFLVVVGLLAWCVIPPALQESRDERLASLIAGTRTALADAAATDDPAQRRTLLEEADARLAQAEALAPEDATVSDLRAQVDAALAALNAVVELPPLDLVVDLTERVPGGISPVALELGGGGAYLLDRERERVVAVALLAPDPEPFVL